MCVSDNPNMVDKSADDKIHKIDNIQLEVESLEHHIGTAREESINNRDAALNELTETTLHKIENEIGQIKGDSTKSENVVSYCYKKEN